MHFYEKLAEKKRDRDSALTGAKYTAGIAGASALGNVMFARGVPQHRTKADAQEMAKLLKKMRAKQTGKNEFILPTKDGKHIEVNFNRGVPIPGEDGKVSGAMYTPAKMLGLAPSKSPKTRGTILMDGDFNKDVFLHELGHGTGLGSRRGSVVGKLGATIGTSATPGLLNLGLQGGAALYAGSATNKEQADRANAMANAALVHRAASELPTLAEEARATIRARGLARKFGQGGLQGPGLANAFGTYLTSATLASSPAIAAKLLAKRKQRLYKDQEGTPSKDKWGDRLLAGNRMLAGSALGGGLLGGAAGAGSGSIQRAIGAGLVGAGLGAYGGYRYNKAQQKKKD